MDAFKLLSRSTTLRARPTSSSNAGQIGQQKQQTPSSGQAADPRIYARDDFTGTQTKKRKRVDAAKEDRKQDYTQLTGELDFFADQHKVEAKKARTDAHETTDAGRQDDQDHSQHHEKPEELDDEQCRRILKTHKIKVARLWAPDDETTKVEKKRKKKKVEAVPETLTKKEKRKRAETSVQPLTDFEQLHSRHAVHRRICDNLTVQGYTTPTEVQMGGLPLLLEHKGPAVDLLSVAPTGSGKTLAFLIPVLNAVKRDRIGEGNRHKSRAVRAVILAPTKELASQIVNEGRKLAIKTGVQITLLKKGMRLGERTSDSEKEETDEIDNGDKDEDESDGEDHDQGGNADEAPTKSRPETYVKADIVVSTPLTMLHALTTKDKIVGMLPTVSLLVLDEADVLLDPLFREQTLGIWNALSNPQLRVSLWSATMGASIEDLSINHMLLRWKSLPQDQQEAFPRAPILRVVVGLKDSAIPTIQHKLIYAANEQGKLMSMRQLLRGDSSTTHSSSETGMSTTNSPTLRPPFLVFTQTITRAVALHAELLYDIPPEAGGSSRIAVLHSDLSDTARDRVMTRFRKGEIWMLITTDLLSRGVDFRGVNGVVNYDFPNSAAAYVHRAGRTGRAGREGGVAFTLYAKEDVPYVKNVANVIAASERLKSAGQNNMSDSSTHWLLGMLPKVSKRDKQTLKRSGVEARRTGKESAKTRISTKSNYERRVQQRKKDAVYGNKKRVERGGVDAGNLSDGSFDGFD